MKKFVMICAALVLLLVFPACDMDGTETGSNNNGGQNGGGVVVEPPSELELRMGTVTGTSVGTEVNLALNKERQFFASAAGATTYIWKITDGGDHVGFKDNVKRGYVVTLESKTLGPATVTVLASNAAGESDTVTFKVNSVLVPTDLDVLVGDTSVGAALDIDWKNEQLLTATAQDATNYAWEITNGDTYVGFKDDVSTGAAVTLEGLIAGTAEITVTANNASGDSDPVIFNVNVNAAITGVTVSVNATPLALNEAVTVDTEGVAFTAEAAGSAMVHGGALTYTWAIMDGDSGTNVEFGSGTTDNPMIIKGKAFGRNRIRVTAANDYGSVFTEFYAQGTEILVNWNNIDNPLTQNITKGHTGYAFDSGNGIYFRAGQSGVEAQKTDDGAIRLEASTGNPVYLIIGGTNLSTAPTPAGTNTNATTIPNGQLDLSSGTFRLSFTYRDVVYSGNRQLLRIGVNNNTGSNGSSPLINSNFFTTSNVTGLSDVSGVEGKYVLEFIPSVRVASATNPELAADSLKTAFVLITHQNSQREGDPNGMTITGITLEKLP